jgi:glycosyltransferase involved in cell wall biosynthesis/GT2 family glycosyltransferase
MSPFPPVPVGGERPLSILVVNPDVPPANRDSGSLRLFRLLELLAAEGHRLTLVARLGLGEGQAAAVLALERFGVEVHCVDPERARALGWRGPQRALDLAGLLQRIRPDVALLSFYDVAEQYLPLLRQHAPGARVAIDTVDVHCVREERAAELSGRAEDRERAARTRERERAVYGAADALVVVSEDDAATLRELAPGVPVSVISNVHAPAPPTAPRAGRTGVVFVGNFRHTPNVDAAVDFVAMTWPRVRAALPGARLQLVGTAPPPEVRALACEDVEVTGWVPETAPYLDAACVSIAPLRFGAGVKGKIGEALGRGLPVVTTTIGAEGLDLVDGENAMVADDPDAQARAIVRLHEDAELWERLSRAGRDAIEAGLSPEAALSGLRGLLAELAPMTYVARGDDDELQAILAGYLETFAEADPVSLVVPLDEATPAAELYERLVTALTALGRDPEHIPDVAVTAWPCEAPLPAAAVAVDGATDWPALAARGATAPRRRRSSPAAAVVVRLPADLAAAREQVDALAAAGLRDDVEVLLCTDDTTFATSGARVVHAPPSLGRRGTLQRAVAATRAGTVVALEPYALPRPGFLAPLLAAVAHGAAFAAPGGHGLRLAPDGSLWPTIDTPDALALDCLAALRDTFLDAPATLPSREGHAEAQLAAWAAQRGALAIAPDARAARAAAPSASVLICTRDRADELEDCIDLLVAHGAQDVVIVDNASTDATPELAAELAARYPDVVRVANEERAGLCHARNAGAAAARHDLLLYIDDDARPAPGWLPAVSRALATDGIVNVGGPICALWPAQRAPDWPEHGLEPLFSVLDLGDADQNLVPPDVVYGANWGIRRSALQAAGGFDPAFGPGPEARINGDEVSVAWRLHERGLGGTRYAAAGAVGHRIPTSRVSERFLVHRSLCVGIERPRHATALHGVDRERLLQGANAAAARLLRLAPLTGDMRLEDAVEAIDRATASQRLRVAAADALGELAGSVLLVGETEVHAGPLHLRLSAAHLNGVLEVRTTA